MKKDIIYIAIIVLLIGLLFYNRTTPSSVLEQKISVLNDSIAKMDINIARLKLKADSLKNNVKIKKIYIPYSKENEKNIINLPADSAVKHFLEWTN